MLCHSLLYSGESFMLFTQPLFIDFLASRHAIYDNLKSVNQLQETQIDIAYNRDVASLKKVLQGRFGWLIWDETPNSKNVPLLNLLIRSVDVLSVMPVVETALLSSEEFGGRCDAAAVVQRVEAAVVQFELVTVRHFCSSNFSFPNNMPRHVSWE
jgi:hypothetical protein